MKGQKPFGGQVVKKIKRLFMIYGAQSKLIVIQLEFTSTLRS